MLEMMRPWISARDVQPGKGHRVPDPAAGFVIDPVTPTSPVKGIFKLELLAVSRADRTVPEQVRDDVACAAVGAGVAHPAGVPAATANTCSFPSPVGSVIAETVFPAASWISARNT